MNEIRRQAYLEAMGIDSWFPRFVLPGAAPSRPCEWPEPLQPRAEAGIPAPVPAREGAAVVPPRSRETATPVPPQPREAGAPAPSRRSREAPDFAPALGREIAASAPARRQPAPPSTPAPGDAPSGIIRFRLAFLRCGPLAVLNQLPHVGRERLGAAQRQLFLNLVRALGLPAEDAWIPEQSFHWPLAQSLLQDAGADAARLALRAYVDEQKGDQRFRVLLVLGAQLAPVVLPSGAEARPGRLLQADDPGCGVLLSRSLDEALSVPALKRELWRDLAAARPALADRV